MDPEKPDPVDWGVEEIVAFLCNPQEAPWSDSATSSRPNLTALEAVLRENEINGEALLHDIDNSVLKDDMGFKVLGHRSSVLRAIAWLRSRSPKYLSKQNFPSSSNLLHSTENFSSSIASAIATPVDPLRRIQSTPPEMTPAPTRMKEKRRIAPTQVIDSQGCRLGDDLVQTAQASCHSRLTVLSPRRELMGNNTTEIAGDDGKMKLALTGLSGANKVTSNEPPPEAFSSEDRSAFLTQKDHDFLDQLLKKWDGDEILPEEEPEYDEEDLAEMQEDLQDSTSVEEHQPEPTSALSRAQCENVFSEYLAQHEKAWDEQHLPRHQHNARIVWQLGHDARTGEAYKSDASRNLGKCRSRLETQLKTFADAGYKSYASLRDVCRVMDTTLDQICLEKWKLDIIELETCPPFVPPPPRVPRPRNSRVLDADEVSLGSESDIPDNNEAADGDTADGDTADDEASADEYGSDSGNDIPYRPERALLAPTSGITALSTIPSDDSAEDFVANKRRRIMGSQDHSEGETSIGASNPGPFAEFEGGGPYHLSNTDHGSPSGALRLDSSPQTLQESDSANAMTIETPPLNPTLPAVSTPDIDMGEELQVKTPPLNPTNPSQPTVRLKLTVSSSEPFSEDTDHFASRPRARKSPSVAASLGRQEDTSPSMDDIDIFDMVIDMTWEAVESSKDRISLLAKHLTCLPPDEHEFFGPYLEQYLDPVYMEEVTAALHAMLNNEWNLEGRTEEESRPAMRLGAYFVSWHLCRMLSGQGMGKERLHKALEALEDDEELTMFMAFIHRLKKLYASYKAWLSRQRLNTEGRSTYTESAGTDSNPRKRKKHPAGARSKVPGLRALSNQQKDAQERQAKMDKDRERLRKAHESKGMSNDDPEGQAVTFKDPVIYLHRHIGQSVKSHQLKGIQFMWRELIEADNQQGCLLAHVMGLGKSMQVISLLVTIATAAASDDPKIRAQVPERFHRSQTLLLCPSSVVQNWLDEFAFWTPIDHHLGPILEISPRGQSPQKEKHIRLQTLREWNRKGGVLIMSYEMLRILILNKRANLDERQHEFVKDCLLEGANIIVADEAHKLRSEKSAISQVASRFKSTSRIALTGSPLSNQLSEYYQMVEWVAPGYLEDPATFKRKFMDPIQAGSYIDSTKMEQRESLRALQLLNGILAPKVLRADTSVLAADLPPKTEFVLTVPLTELQRNAYDAFVDCAGSGDADASMRLWSWLAIMQLCCNHPFPFREKLADRLRQQEDREGQFEGNSLLPKSIQDAGLPSDLIARMDVLFSKYSDLQDIALSNRAILLDQILDLSIQARDKVLIFTQSIPTMNYLNLMLEKGGRQYLRIDGSTPGPDRQTTTKQFNSPGGENILLISTRAGGVGLNMYGANRVIIFDFLFNPMWEEQAVGRAYRLGQKKPVFVYRFLAGGTFEELIFNNAVFKRQLAVRVVDKKTVVRESTKNASTYLTHVKDVQKVEKYDALGRDPRVLDQILNGEYSEIVLKATLSHIQDNENDHLTPEESRQVEDELKMERLKRADPLAYHAEMKRRDDAEKARQQEAARHQALQWQKMQQEQQRLLQVNQTPQKQDFMMQQRLARFNHYNNLQVVLNRGAKLLEQSVQRRTVLNKYGRTMLEQHKLLQMNRADQQQDVTTQQRLASLHRVPMSTVGRSPLSVYPKGAAKPKPPLSGANSVPVTHDPMHSHAYQPSSSSFLRAPSPEQPVSASTYTPSSTSLRQADGGESRLAFVVPAGNEVIVIDDDSAHSTPVKALPDRSHVGSASSPADDHPVSPTQADLVDHESAPQETVDAHPDKAATTPVSRQSEPMDLSESSVSNNVTIDASLDKAATTPIAFSQSEAMHLSDGT